MSTHKEEKVMIIGTMLSGMVSVTSVASMNEVKQKSLATARIVSSMYI